MTSTETSISEILRCCAAGDSLSKHNGYQFTTKDADHDARSDINCAQTHPGAWWFINCQSSHLNGVYISGGQTSFEYGIVWPSYRNTFLYFQKMTEMKI